MHLRRSVESKASWVWLDIGEDGKIGLDYHRSLFSLEVDVLRL